MQNEKRLALDWARKIHTLEYAHRLESKKYEFGNYYLGIPCIIIAALIGIHLTNAINTAISSILTGIGGCVVTILTGLQTFLRPTEIAQQHRNISKVYENLRHRLEFLIVFDCLNDKSFLSRLTDIKNDWERIETLNFSNRTWAKAKKLITKLNTYPQSLQLDE